METTSSDGSSLHFEVHGDGPAVVLAHGSLMEGASWVEAGYTDAFAGFRSIVMDCRGYGASDKPHELSSYRAELYVDDIVAVADAADAETFAVGGYSWGTIGAWRVAAWYPDRVRGLFAIGGRHPDLYLWDRDVMEQMRVEPMRQIGLEGICEYMRAEEGPLPEWWARQVLACDAEAYIAQRYAAVDMTRLAPAEVKVPVLLVSGAKEDPDKDSLLIAGSLDDADAMIVDGRGHCQNFLAPETLEAVRNFLEKVLA
jgi:pimeloyl-ACP methyl ester carboxylesterase